jgi:hypothetical protein
LLSGSPPGFHLAVSGLTTGESGGMLVAVIPPFLPSARTSGSSLQGRFISLAVAVLTLGVVPTYADQDRAEKPLGEAYQALEREFEVARKKSEETAGYAPRFLKLAERDPAAPAALEALVWVVTQAPSAPEVERALELLLAHHHASEKLGLVCSSLIASRSPGAVRALRAIGERSPHRAVKGRALWALAARLHRTGAASQQMFEEVIQTYGDVSDGHGGTLGAAAEAALARMRPFAIGATALEIEGEDLEGKKFRLSDYRGKVVVLDFWGDW